MPAPSRRHGNRLCLRAEVFDARRRHDHGAVGKQVLGEGQERLAQRALRDHGAEAGTVDEQVAFDALSALTQQRGNIALGR